MEEPVSSYPFHADKYPGKMPSYSYFLSKDFVHELHIVGNAPLHKAIVDYKSEKIELHLLLDKLSLKPLKDRYAIIGYGSNACPGMLVKKGIFNLPIVKASAKNIDVVYAFKKTNYGAVPATIAKSFNTSLDVWASFLDEDQLQKMDKSEGREKKHYDLVELKNCLVTLPNGQVLSPAYAYVANKKGIALKDDQPIALASIHANNRNFSEMYEREILKIISNCKKGETKNYLDFRVIPLEKLPEKFNNPMFQGIIIDLAVFNDAERLRSFSKSMLNKDYIIAIASDIYFMIKEGMWEELSELMQNWEWNTKREKLIKWHKTQEFRALCKDVVDVVVPCGRILEELSDDEKNVLKQLSKVIEPGSPRIIEIAKEFIKTSVVKRFPILSYTKHARRWFKNCKNVLTMEIMDAPNSVSGVKKDIKIRVEKAGWRGYIYLFIFGLVADTVLEVALPPPIGTIIGKTSAGSFVIGVLADGKKDL